MGAGLLGLHGMAFGAALLLIWWRDHATSLPRWTAARRRDGITKATS
jgi:hypothetical protein